MTDIRTPYPVQVDFKGQVESVALKVNGVLCGCLCGANARLHDQPETVIVRRKRFMRPPKIYGYVAGPVILYRNKGLTDGDVAEILKAVFTTTDGTPRVVASDDLINMAYDEDDP